MKKIVASVGLAAIGASGIESASAQALVAPDASKPWSVSATLRGFYDSNPSTLPNDVPVPSGYQKESAGFQFEPSAALLWSVEETTVNLGVLYSLKYYDNTPINSTDHTDQSFSFNAGLTHAFSEETKFAVSDSFVIGQEPDMLRAGNTFSTFQRISGDNIRNAGTIDLETQITPEFGLGVGYDNSYYDYQDTQMSTSGAQIVPSIAGTLNRIENRAHLEAFWRLNPETKLLVGYQFTGTDYTSDQPIAGLGFVPNPTWFYANQRNSYENTGYVGAEHAFRPDLTGSIRVGGSYTDYYNDSGANNPVTPYVNAILKYTYAPESHVDFGFSYDVNATDVVGPQFTLNGTTATLDAQSAVVFVDVTHRLTPHLYGSLTAQYQNSEYNGGAYNGDSDNYYLVGLQLEYRFTQYFSASVGYNYDDLQSDIPDRSFNRNRVYIGVTATY
jgi:hypothetical protein